MIIKRVTVDGSGIVRVELHTDSQELSNLVRMVGQRVLFNAIPDETCEVHGLHPHSGLHCGLCRACGPLGELPLKALQRNGYDNMPGVG